MSADSRPLDAIPSRAVRHLAGRGAVRVRDPGAAPLRAVRDDHPDPHPGGTRRYSDYDIDRLKRIAGRHIPTHQHQGSSETHPPREGLQVYPVVALPDPGFS
ncbi:hypothetical protein RHA1_ro03569 [Rhodococcus jostii RHA1]|uniref:Uncharacterized protein n=1 Tax=Rhodococcus jostii (strain RHA1) TaxID=101510 RepID=Q0SAR4_RHOJR|nr:hypothetical protein RHA1_ro03569 [Rhodococcus jostii RHA1]